MFYTRKNLGWVADKQEAEEYLKRSGLSSAIYFQFEKSGVLNGMYLLGNLP